MRKLVRLVVLAVVAMWAWRRFMDAGRSQARAGVSFADGSSLVLEPGTAGFEKLAAIARPALRG